MDFTQVLNHGIIELDSGFRGNDHITPMGLGACDLQGGDRLFLPQRSMAQLEAQINQRASYDRPGEYRAYRCCFVSFLHFGNVIVINLIPIDGDYHHTHRCYDLKLTDWRIAYIQFQLGINRKVVFLYLHH